VFRSSLASYRSPKVAPKSPKRVHQRKWQLAKKTLLPTYRPSSRHQYRGQSSRCRARLSLSSSPSWARLLANPWSGSHHSKHIREMVYRFQAQEKWRRAFKKHRVPTPQWMKSACRNSSRVRRSPELIHKRLSRADDRPKEHRATSQVVKSHNSLMWCSTLVVQVSLAWMLGREKSQPIRPYNRRTLCKGVLGRIGRRKARSLRLRRLT